ncbi:zinc finger protein 729 [Bombyx mori]|uniref:Uncharacterized protein n=1 Tax=Bombyx mori TaxID=7091 RepID=A0A8R2CA18_BOMMO|nr:zinc finger protein 729 [Bombyx mori]
MALKLGKCRLCLKLGDFYSIFTMDNAVQLAEMVMECARIKVYEGDGLPDKICSECIQKLSSAYIFKQQCERADQELRRNYVPPPGFSVSPAPTSRQSNDSAISTQTDSSNVKNSASDGKLTNVQRSRKRSIDSDNTSTSSVPKSQTGNSKRIEELRRTSKRAKVQPKYFQVDSDCDDVASPISFAESGGTDTEECPVKNKSYSCSVCNKDFKSGLSLSNHSRIHKNDSVGEYVPHDTPNKLRSDVKEEEPLTCQKCGKSFKLKIMLNRHKCETSGHKELLVSLKPIDGGQYINMSCEFCSAKFYTIESLENHMKLAHAASPKNVLERPDKPDRVPVPCLFCRELFDDYPLHNSHFNSCEKKIPLQSFDCPLCDKNTPNRTGYFLHLRVVHFKYVQSDAVTSARQCRICNKKLATEAMLIAHLASHVTNNDAVDAVNSSPKESTADKRASPSTPGEPLKCSYCDRTFLYKKSLSNHERKHEDGTLTVKLEDNVNDSHNDSSLLSETNRASDTDSSQDETYDFTCDVCDKQFSYRKQYIHHKKTKHTMCAGVKRSKITLKNCTVTCRICDVEMKVSDVKEHNQKHLSENMNPRNIYSCNECDEKFKSCKGLADHIKFVHRLKQTPPAKMSNSMKFDGPDLADFCEVVVTKTEPLDRIQTHNGFKEVPLIDQYSDATPGPPDGDATSFSCHICGKNMPTLISLKRHVNWHLRVGNNIEKQVECFVCQQVFRFQCHYKAHMREHYRDPNIDPKLLICSICNRKSKHLRAAQMHMIFHKQTRFQNKDYQCAICKKVFQNRKLYLYHMSVHQRKGESGQNTIVGLHSSGTGLPNKAESGEDGSLTCQICGKVCNSESSLKHHTVWHNSKTLLYGARYECPVCKVQFTNKRYLAIHERTHYEDDNGPYKCKVCGKGFIDEDYHRRHQMSHNFSHSSHKKRIENMRKGKVKCPYCPRYFDVLKLFRHLKSSHPQSKMIKSEAEPPPQRQYSCKLCAKQFRDEKRLQHHEEAHLRKPEFFKCKFCGKKTISLKNHRIHIKSHLTSKFTDAPLKCSRCEETFVRGYDLHHHLRDSHGVHETWIAERTEPVLDGPLHHLQCSICFKILASKGNFERHIDYHNSLRCNYCFDYFTTPRFLEGHLAFSCAKKKLIGDTEVYPKKLKCDICYKAFHLQVKLDCHRRTQHAIRVSREARVGNKKTVCDFCFKVFESEDILNSHKKYHRTIGYYGCIYCKKKFGTPTLYRKHKTYHLSQKNEENPTKCEHCDETFVAFRDMIQHMRSAHGDHKEWIVMPKDSVEEKCHICNKTFFNLHKHLAYHEENRCKKCGKYFFSEADFDGHLCAIESDDEAAADVNNAGAPAYEECRFCFKPITRKNTKRLHDGIHKTSGAISCRFCTFKFKTMDSFRVHAFSHRSRKYNAKPIKCRKCGEKFVKYGPFIKHMRNVHKSTKKVHYRATVQPEECVVCGDHFPNLHNHYRAHLLNRCQLCKKYFTSFKLFSAHECDKEDSDPSKVFTSDANLDFLIRTYVPKEERDDEKYYGYTDSEEENETEDQTANQSPVISDVLSLFRPNEAKYDEDSQTEEVKSESVDSPGEEVKSQEGGDQLDDNVVNLIDDELIEIEDQVPIIVLDDD